MVIDWSLEEGRINRSLKMTLSPGLHMDRQAKLNPETIPGTRIIESRSMFH
jgi:hypothetical protein